MSRQPRLPLDPLIQQYGNVFTLALATGRHHSQLYAWRRDGGIPLWSADDVAMSLGMHPFEVWPDWFDLEPA